MKIEVRYCSRSGNTKALAEAIAKALEINAVSIDSDEASINNETDILFIGGALYAYGLDKKLTQYIMNFDASKIKKAIVFSTSWLSKHSVVLIKKALKEKGIDVLDEYIYFKNMPSAEELTEAERLAKELINK